MKLSEAISQLDHTQDGHWTEDGMPSVEAVAAIFGKEVDREQITKAAPNLVRKAKEPSAEEPPAPADEEPPAPADEEPMELGQARALVIEHDDELGSIDDQMEALRKKRDEVQKSRDKIVTETDAGQNTPHHQLVQDYFASQDKNRMEQAANIAAAHAFLSKAPGQIGSGASQLDQAMVNKRGHGLKRPAFTTPAK
jgi:hypothetical protein